MALNLPTCHGLKQQPQILSAEGVAPTTTYEGCLDAINFTGKSNGACFSGSHHAGPETVTTDGTIAG
jgi:hypothetical protein